MTEHVKNREEEPVSPPETPSETTTEGDDSEGEIRLTIRKLEVPVRPRGVLAE